MYFLYPVFLISNVCEGFKIPFYLLYRKATPMLRKINKEISYHIPDNPIWFEGQFKLNN